MSEYLNFELSIVELRGGGFLASLPQLPVPDIAGPVNRHFDMPFDPPSLEKMLEILSHNQGASGNRETTARQFGEAMFKAVFGGGILQAYKTSILYADEQGKGLRVRLNLTRAGSLATLPWEFLRDPEVDYLALSRATPLIRYTPRYVSFSRLDTVLPLRILVMISAPVDLPVVDEAAERRNLEEATRNLRERGLVEIEYLEDASLRTLQRVLRERDFHVFHYIGHSGFNPKTKIGTLALEDPYGKEKAFHVRGEALARELHEEEGIRLVVLNSCEGAQTDVRDPFSGIASSLVQRGIPAVLAQQFEISDRAAVVFSEEFYRAIAEGFPIEGAVAEGRRAIGSTVNNTEWATPVLFLYDNDTRKIFDFSRPPLRKRTAMRRLMVVVGLLLLLIFTAGGVIIIRGGDGDASAFFPPPTATRVPNVDLEIADIRLSPQNPQPGSFVAVFIDIENKGADASPPFTYEYQPNILDPDSTITEQVEGLAAGGISRETLTYRFGGWGTFISEVRLDTLGQIIELSEDNRSLKPVRMDSNLPFVIDFSEPLPNGDFVRQNMPVTSDILASWGMRISAESTDSDCADVVPWLRFVGISQVALGTGLPDDGTQCTSATLVITFLQRADNNPVGARAVGVFFAPGDGQRNLSVYSDAEGDNFLSEYYVEAERTLETVVSSSPASSNFKVILSAQISSDSEPLNITRIRLTAP